MVDTLEDIDPPYREGDSDRVQRDPKWPSLEESEGRINVIIDTMKEDGVGVAARDLIVLMRELGRLTAENRRLREVLARARLLLDGYTPSMNDDALDLLAEIDAALKDKP